MAEKGTFELSEAMSKEAAEQAALVAEFELRRKAKTIVVPTDDAKVRAMLRQLNEPITLFGEKEMERRERLRRLLAQQEPDLGEGAPVVGQLVVEEQGVQQTEKFYTEGPEELVTARTSMAQWSMRHASQRLAAARRLHDDADARGEARALRKSLLSAASQLAQQVSELGDERPISGCAFSPNGSQLATCGWGGMLTCWDVAAGCGKRWSVRAHDERCTGVTWHPAADTSPSPGAEGMDTEGPGGSTVALATASADATARLFTRTGKLLRTLSGHTDRLARLAFHPQGQYLATASFDMTWRLWDVETGLCLCEQEGHSREVYAVGFHPDGSLAASAGLDAIGRVWDVRTGRSVFVLEGHVKQILCLDFSPGGTTLVTGSDDHTCKVWDLRQRVCRYTIPAHGSLVSSCRHEQGCGGEYLATGGYDGLVKVWSCKDYKLVKSLAGHEGKVMGVDVSVRPIAGGPASVQDQSHHVLASVSYDRTLKLWAPDMLPTIGAAVTDDPGSGAMEL